MQSMFGIKGGSRIEWSESRWTTLDKNLDYTISLVVLSKWLVQKFDESCPNAPLLHCFWVFGVCHLGRWHADMEKRRENFKTCKRLLWSTMFWCLVIIVSLCSVAVNTWYKKNWEKFIESVFYVPVDPFHIAALCASTNKLVLKHQQLGHQTPHVMTLKMTNHKHFHRQWHRERKRWGIHGQMVDADLVIGFVGLFVRLGNVIWNFLDFDLINFVSRHVCPMLLLKINIYICPSLHQPWLRTNTCKSRCVRELVSTKCLSHHYISSVINKIRNIGLVELGVWSTYGLERNLPP